MLAVGIPPAASNFPMSFEPPSHHLASVNPYDPPPPGSSPPYPSYAQGPAPPQLQPTSPPPTIMPRLSNASSTSPQMVASTSAAAAAVSPPPPLDPPFRGYIDTTLDALLVLEAARRGMIPRVTRRLIERERGMIQSGSVFVFDEHESGIKRWTDGLIWSPSRILNNFLVYRQQDKRQGTASASNSERRQSQQQQPQQLQQYSFGAQPVATQYSYDEYGAPVTYANAGAPAASSLSSHRPQLSAASVSGLDVLTRPRSASDSVKKERSSSSFANEGLVKKTMSVNINGFAQHLISYYRVADVEAGRLKRPSTIPELAGLEISPEYLRKQNFRFPPLIEVGPDGVERYKGETADPATQASAATQPQAGLVSPGMYSRPSTSTSSGGIMTPITPVAYYGPPPGSSGSSVGYDTTPQQIHYAPPVAELPPMKPSYGKQPSASAGAAMVRQASEGGTRDSRRSSRRYDPYGSASIAQQPFVHQSSPAPPASSAVAYSGYAPTSSIPTTPVHAQEFHHMQPYRTVGPPPSYLPMSIDTGMAAPYSTASGYGSPAESFASPPTGSASGFASSTISSTPQFIGQDFDAIDGAKSISSLSISSPYPGLDLQLYGQQQHHHQQQPVPPPTAPGPPTTSWIEAQQDAQLRMVRPHTAAPLSLDSRQGGYHLPSSGAIVDDYHSAFDNSMQAQQQQAMMHSLPTSRPMGSSQSQPGSLRNSPQQPIYEHRYQQDAHEMGPSVGVQPMPIPNAADPPHPHHPMTYQQPHHVLPSQAHGDAYYDPGLAEQPQQHSY